ncbi:MAG: hypothetical protein JNK02_12405 [Planctomycetes bacterium]|nr:hypothetical protein [Planctomycetota bacterium]
MAQRIPLGLLVAIGAYVALRVLILATSFESVALPMYELYPMGTMAELLRQGIDFPVRWFYDNAAGQLLMGWLTVPVFGLFGSTYLALKLLPAALGLATLVLVWLVLDRHVSRRAAGLGALFVAVGPPTLAKYSLINSGNHFENLCFSSLALLLAYRWFADPAKPRAGLLAYACACGFAIFVFLGALIPVGILFGMHAGIRGLRRAARDLPVLAAGFVLGLAPLLVVNLATAGRGAGFLDAKFGGETSARGADVWARMGEFLGPALWRAGVFEDLGGVPRELLASLFLAAFVAAYAAAVPGVASSVLGCARRLAGPVPAPREELAAFERAKLAPFVIYLPLAALAYGISNFRLGGHATPVEIAGYRYYLPALLYAGILIAATADRWLAAGGTRRTAGIALLAATGIPCASSLGVPDWTCASTGVGSRLDGYNLAQLARALVSSRNAVPQSEIVARVRGLPEAARARTVLALGFNLGVARAETTVARGAPLALAEHLAPWPPEWHAALAQGLGHGLRFQARVRGAPPQAALDDARLVLTDDALLRDALERGLSRPNVGLPMPWETARILGENADVLEDRGSAARGFARGTRQTCRELVERGIPSDLAPALAVGRVAAAIAPD